MATLIESMRDKADELVRQADALRLAADIMNGHGAASVAKRLPATLASAIALRQTQNGNNGHTPGGKRSGKTAANARRARAESIAFLARFDPVTPRPNPGGPRLSALLQHGYLARKGAGYVRTSKVLSDTYWKQTQTAAAKAPKNGTPPPSRKKQLDARDAKARIVAQILKDKGPLTSRELSQLVGEQIEVGPTGLTGIYAYVQRGYITQHKTKGGTTRDGMTYAFKAMPPEARP